ncbi:anti-sigma factor domain-containing protein [Fusibacter sp. JL298sf-3]
MRKGLVFSVRQDAVVVLDEAGTYVKLKKKPGLTVGQTIYYFEEDRLQSQKRFNKRWLAVAAMFLILLGSWQIFERTAVYGYVTVDINPSVEFVLGPSTRVKKVLALNEDASTFALEVYREMPVQEAVLAFIDEAEAKGFIIGNDNAVTVSYIPVSRKALNFTGFDDVLRGAIESADLQARMTVTVLETDAAHLEAATTAGEPLGHYVEHVPESAKVKKVYPRDEGEDEMSEEVDDTDVRFDGEDEASDDNDDEADDDDVFETDDDAESESADDSVDDEVSAPSLPDKPEVQEQETDDDTDSEVKGPTTDDDAFEEEEVDDDATEEVEEAPSEAEEEVDSEGISEAVSEEAEEEEEGDEVDDTEEIDD